MPGDGRSYWLAAWRIWLARDEKAMYIAVMARTEPQLNIRSAVARERAAWLARRTGMTTTQVVEAALKAYIPPETVDEADNLVPLPPGMIRKGWLPVMAATGGRVISAEEAQAAIDASREERSDAVWNCA